MSNIKRFTHTKQHREGWFHTGQGKEPYLNRVNGLDIAALLRQALSSAPTASTPPFPPAPVGADFIFSPLGLPCTRCRRNPLTCPPSRPTIPGRELLLPILTAPAALVVAAVAVPLPIRLVFAEVALALAAALTATRWVPECTCLVLGLLGNTYTQRNGVDTVGGIEERWLKAWCGA